MQQTISNVLKSVLKSKWYPVVFQWPVLLVFSFLTYELLFGSSDAHSNFGTAMTWVLWWPIIPLVFLAFGRFWCAICPFATLSDFLQKIVGNNRPVPAFLKKYGIWLIDIFFILITWADHVYGIVESPRGSGIMMLIITTGVIISGSFFERRTWCRYLCFLGGVAGNYSRSGAVALRATPEKCAACTALSCYKGGEKAPGCPMFEVPRTMDSSARCNLCGYCVKNCPNDSITVTPRVPSKELWFITKPKFEEAFLAIVIMGIVFVQNITMLELWEEAQRWLEMLLGTNSYAVTFTVTIIIAMAIPVALLYGASWVSAQMNGEGVNLNFARFGYALIPLDLAGHLAHNLFHLLVEGKSIFITGLALIGLEAPVQPGGLVDPGMVQLLQYMLILLGGLGSAYTAYRIAKSNFADQQKVKSYIPIAVLTAVFVALNIYLFMLPMAHRM